MGCFSPSVVLVAAEEGQEPLPPDEVALKRWRIQTFRVALEVKT